MINNIKEIIGNYEVFSILGTGSSSIVKLAFIKNSEKKLQLNLYQMKILKVN